MWELECAWRRVWRTRCTSKRAVLRRRRRYRGQPRARGKVSGKRKSARRGTTILVDEDGREGQRLTVGSGVVVVVVVDGARRRCHRGGLDPNSKAGGADVPWHGQ